MTDLTARPVGATARIVDIAVHAARMGEPLASFRQVAAAGRHAAPAPAFLFGPMGEAAARALYGQIETPAVGCYAIADAAVAPTGIGLRDGTAFAGDALNLPAEHVATITARLNASTLPVRHVPGPLVALFGPAEEAWTPLLVDYLPRLWLLEQAGYRLGTLRFLLPATLASHAEALPGLLGLPPDRVVRYAHWEEVVRTDLLVLPTVLRLGTRLAPGFGAATRLWTARVRDALGLPEPVLSRRLFVRAGRSRATGLEAMAEGHGYEVVQPDALDMAGRARLFGAASHIVGAPGALLHASVFAVAGARVCVLSAEAAMQAGIGTALGHETGIVFGAPDEADFRRALEVMEL